MNRFLHYFNLVGVIALAALCVAQWQVNRRVNLEANRLEQIRLDQNTKLEEQGKTLKGYVADLDELRKQLTLTHTSLKETESKNAVTDRQVRQLTAESEQLKASVTNWASAVAARDERLKETYEQIQKSAQERNDAVVKFNELAGKYNATVKDLNTARAQIAALLASQTNSVKPAAN